MYSRILIFAAHDDDEISMAGTIAKLSGHGTEVTVVMFTDGREGYPDAKDRDTIVSRREQEAAECDKVLGVAHRIRLKQPDMVGDGYELSALHEAIRAIRTYRPEAVFTHGPNDRHRDHRALSAMSLDAVFHAGEPVSALLGSPWKTPWIFYYKGVDAGKLPRFEIDITDTAHKRFEALATQVSQFTLFKTTKEELVAKVEQMRRERKPTVETFHLCERIIAKGFPQTEESL